MEIPKIDPFWDEQMAHPGHRHGVSQPGVGSSAGSSHSSYERNLNFATVAVEDGDYGFPKKKTVRDPLSHRIIEKRRRDRMNNCLADLARLLPPSSLRKGRGRIEKTEIVELAIKHLRHLQCHPCPNGDKCEYSVGVGIGAENSGGTHNNSPTASCSSSSTSSGYHSTTEEQFRLGFQECLSEAMHFLVEQEGLYAGDATCVRLVKHLNSHCDTVLRDHWGNQGKIVPGFRRNADASGDFKKTGCSNGSSSSGYHPNGSSSGSDGNGINDGESTEPFALPVQNNPPQHSNMESSVCNSSVLDYEAENSCSSTPLSIETSDVLSTDGKNNCRMSTKPPIPSIICSHSSSTNSRIPVNSGSPANGSNGRTSDDGSANSSTCSAHHRYKFKSNIKQRFTADCQTTDDDHFPQENRGKGSHCEVEGDGDVDVSSDMEETRDEGMDDSVSKSCGHGGHSGAEELELRASPCRRASLGERIAHSDEKAGTQISAVGTSSSSLEKTAFSSDAPNSSCTDIKTSTDSENPEVKPTPEELLTAIHNLSSPSHNPQLPAIVGGDGASADGKGVPAFVLHEKGLFYVPLTIDKTIVSKYVNKQESTNAPPLYPVTISVCFVLGPDKKGIHVSDPTTADCDKATDFSQSSGNTITLPILPGASTSVMKYNSRRGHRDSNGFIPNRYSHQKQQSSHKESHHHHSRGIGHIAPPPFYHSYQEGNSSTCSPVPSMSDLNRGSTDESETNLGSYSRSNAGGSISSSSGIMGLGSATRGRKRSISSSPSVTGSASGASLGYHSWNDKASPESHEFFNFHSNTHNLPAIALHGHLKAAAVAAAVSPAALNSLNQRHSQAYNNFHMENALRDKEICFSHEKRSKKARSMDQSMDSKHPIK